MQFKRSMLPVRRFRCIGWRLVAKQRAHGTEHAAKSTRTAPPALERGKEGPLPARHGAALPVAGRKLVRFGQRRVDVNRAEDLVQ